MFVTLTVHKMVKSNIGRKNKKEKEGGKRKGMGE
jgi:hypothetical protein